MRKITITFGILLMHIIVAAQDPHFSQFFMAPNFVNPAISAVSSSDWRIMGNLRQQWGNAGTPFNTQTVAAEMKITGQEKYDPNIINQNTLACGVSMMLDQSMFGAFKSTYAVGTVAYKAVLSDEQSISLGMHGMYGNRVIDYTRLTFGEQFTSGGFNASFPSGEQALSSMKSFFSLGAGLLYNYQSQDFNLVVGGAAYHLNNPKQTFLKDPTQIIPKRYVAHSNVEFPISKFVSLNLNACYQIQALPAYFSAGGAVGYDLSGDKNSILYAGGWFREGDSFYPYLGWSVGLIQIGFSYDVVHSKQNLGPSNPRSFEMSFVVRQKSDPNKKFRVGCPQAPW
jgi:type IX secretion system PorP/SprF family membrane protein